MPLRPIVFAIFLVSVPFVAFGQGLDDMFKGTIDRLFGDDAENSASSEKDGETESVRVPASRAEIQLSFAPVVERVADSVVNVYGTQSRSQFQSPFAGDPFFERFFGTPRQRGKSSLGSGVIVDGNGTILTNNHVVENMDSLKVALADGREFDAEIVLKDKKSDLAVLKAEVDDELRPIEIGDSDAVQVGDLVLAIGNPFGVGQTVTSGIVSAVSRSLAGVNDYGYFIQTDAAINPGNSGGALVDMNGRLIGINTMIYSRSGGSIGIGYAIPSNMTRVILNSAETGDRVTRPWIGASFRNVSAEIAESLDLDRPLGALVVDVLDDSPAAEAGLRPGDVILAVNGQAIQHPDALGYRMDTIGVGQEAELEILSRSSRKSVRVALLAPPETVPRDIRSLPRGSELYGAAVANLSPALAQEAGLTSGVEGVVVLQVGRGTPAAYLGVARGDIILSVNNVDVENTRQLENLTTREATDWQIVVKRGDAEYVFEIDGPFLRRYRR